MRSWGHPVAATRHPHVADLWHVQRHVSCNHNFRPPLCALFPVFQVETFAAYSILLPCIPNHFRTPHLGFSLRPYGPLSPFHQTHNAPPPPPRRHPVGPSGGCPGVHPGRPQPCCPQGAPGGSSGSSSGSRAAGGSQQGWGGGGVLGGQGIMSFAKGPAAAGDRLVVSPGKMRPGMQPIASWSAQALMTSRCTSGVPLAAHLLLCVACAVTL